MGAEWGPQAVHAPDLAVGDLEVSADETQEHGRTMTIPDPWMHRAGWASDAVHVADARQFVTQHLTEHELPREVDVLRLVVSELATNAVMHAATPFTVSLGRLDGTLTLSVRDLSFDHPQGPARPRSTTLRGRGLHIVDVLSSAWGVTAERDGKTVWAEFNLPERNLA
jgi:anti-sigma regulatory factor (Ser/Thr protein kinase)